MFLGGDGAFWVPWVSDKLPRLVRDDMLRDEEASVKALDVAGLLEMAAFAMVGSGANR